MKKGNAFDQAGNLIILVMVFSVVFIAIFATLKTKAYTCAGAVDSLKKDIENTVQSFNDNVQTGVGKVQPAPSRIPSCVVCVYKDGNNLVFKLEEGGTKNISLTDNLIDPVKSSNGDIESCESSGINGGKNYNIEVRRDSIELDKETELTFTKV